MKKIILILGVMIGMFAGSVMAALSVVTVKTIDSGGSTRSHFSSTEKIGFSIDVINSAASTNRIRFSFTVKDPSGRSVFTHSGNSAPGSAGTSGTHITNISIGKFFGLAGFYTLEASASLDGTAVSGTHRFQVTSPVITLSYPPNGSRDLTAQPLIFRWAGSGATKYRVLVGEHQSLAYNTFSDITTRTSYSYPDNPSNERHKLVSGQRYYWKVEGLDDTGNVVAETSVPFSFSIKLSGSQVSKDVVIKAINIGTNALGPGFVPVKVMVKNQGTTTEISITVDLYINGLPVNKKKKINRIEPGREIQVVFPVRIPEVTDRVLITASHDLYDDNLSNNRMSQIFEEKDLLFSASKKKRTEHVDLSAAWEKVKRVLNRPDIIAKFEGYTLYAIDPDSDEGMELFEDLINGKATVIKCRITLQR